MRHFALLGASLSHSFSQHYFEQKFTLNGIDADYENLELDSLSGIRELVFRKGLSGFNVTIPYKEKILDYCDKRTAAVSEIGAANCIQVVGNEIIAHNTDHTAFQDSLNNSVIKTAIILGSGGASRAVGFTLRQMGVHVQTVSRTVSEKTITYSELHQLEGDVDLLVNCTPLGTFPNTSECPNIPAEQLGKFKMVYDLIYNPPMTELLKRAKQSGAEIKNGEEMLHLQAERSWKIWNNELEEL